MKQSVNRLYNTFKPLHYDIAMRLEETYETFSGKVVIHGHKSGRPSKRITLHAKGLSIGEATLTHTDKKAVSRSIAITRTVTHASYDELRIHTDEMLYPGSYEVTIAFNAHITVNMDGIYPCFYMEDGQQKKLIATQFESHHAREAFPCIDEPEAKATFQLRLTAPESHVALSNTEPDQEIIKDGMKTTVFKVTPVMSTYLLAFVSGELSYLETHSQRGVRIRTYATREQVAYGSFALSVAAKCLDFYEDYFDIPYPLEKCDFVALPDFASGAMENWGLITFREQTLLFDELNTSLSTKQYVAIVVAHELTHQWFGNLVTMQWWTDLWLNEGFASWMEYLAVDSLFPEWHIWTQYAVDDQQLALKLDALEHTHPVEVSINHPDEIRSIFDAISYQKGSSVIQMLHEFLGPEPFKKGIRRYLREFSYKNTVTNDLWDALETETGKPVRNFMNDWTTQSGFPLLTVLMKSDHITISQNRFITNPLSSLKDAREKWSVPLLSPGVDRDLLTSKAANIPRSAEEFIKLNNGQKGFYRVRYDEASIALQAEALRNGELSDLDKMGLLADSFEITKAGYQSVPAFLNLLTHYNRETSLPTWDIIANSITSIRAVLAEKDTSNILRDAMKPFIITMASEQYERLGWDKSADTSHMDTLLRPTMIGLLSGADHLEVNDKLMKLYGTTLTHTEEVDPDLRAIIYTTAVRKNAPQVFDDFLSLYKRTKSSDEKLSITSALTSFEDAPTHQKTLALITDGTVKLQDISYWVAYSFMNRFHRDATWEWLVTNWEWLKKHIGTDLSFYRMPIYAARSFAEEYQLNEYRTFFDAHMLPGLDRSYRQGIEMIETAMCWRQRDHVSALEWFKRQY